MYGHYLNRGLNKIVLTCRPGQTGRYFYTDSPNPAGEVLEVVHEEDEQKDDVQNKPGLRNQTLSHRNFPGYLNFFSQDEVSSSFQILYQ